MIGPGTAFGSISPAGSRTCARGSLGWRRSRRSISDRPPARAPSSPSAGVGAIDHHSAYRFESARVEYRLHPLHGRELRVVQRMRRDGYDVVWLEEREDLCRELPAWMCDAAICPPMATLGPPLVRIDALNTLAAILSVKPSVRDGGASLEASPVVKEAADEKTITVDGSTVAGPGARSGAVAGDRGSGGSRPGSGRSAHGGSGDRVGHKPEGGRR